MLPWFFYSSWTVARNLISSAWFQIHHTIRLLRPTFLHSTCMLYKMKITAVFLFIRIDQHCLAVLMIPWFIPSPVTRVQAAIQYCLSVLVVAVTTVFITPTTDPSQVFDCFRYCPGVSGDSPTGTKPKSVKTMHITAATSLFRFTRAQPERLMVCSGRSFNLCSPSNMLAWKGVGILGIRLLCDCTSALWYPLYTAAERERERSTSIKLQHQPTRSLSLTHILLHSLPVRSRFSRLWALRFLDCGLSRRLA